MSTRLLPCARARQAARPSHPAHDLMVVGGVYPLSLSSPNCDRMAQRSYGKEGKFKSFVLIFSALILDFHEQTVTGDD
jgi:hypothetical protein